MSTPGDDIAESCDSPKETSGRIRVSIACQHCRARKIKCDGEVPCGKCTESGIICHPGAKRKKRAPSRKDQYIRELEKKLQDLQSLALSPHERQESPPLIDGDPTRGTVRQNSNDRPVLANSALFKQGNSQQTEYQYFGASSALSSIEADAFKPPSQAASQRAGFDNDPDDTEGDTPGFVSHHGVDSDLDTSFQAVQAQLPPPETIQLYVDHFFDMFRARVPLLSEFDFRAQVHAFLSEDREEPPSDSFMMTFLMVMALGEYASSGDGGTDNVRQVPGWRYFLSAYSGVREGLRQSNIEFMQAVHLQILFLQGIAKLSVAYVLLGSLIRIMHASGMHRAQDLEAPEGIARTNLMNVVYVEEKLLALCLGRPSLIQDFDCDFHTPSPPSPSDPDRPPGILAIAVHLSRIAGQIHRLLYSPDAARSSNQTYLQNIDRCEAELERWRTSYMPSFPRGGAFPREPEIPPEVYYSLGDGIQANCITYMYLLCNVRRATPTFHNTDNGSSVLGVDQQSVDVAIAMIRLIHLDNRPTEPVTWLAIYKAFTAAAILYQSLKTKATLSTQSTPPPDVGEGIRLQINAMRVLESLFLTRVRGYTGAARYFARVIRAWIDQFEVTFNVPRSGLAAQWNQREGYTTPGAQRAASSRRSSNGASAYGISRAESFGSWTPSAMQQSSRYNPARAAPLPHPPVSRVDAGFTNMYPHGAAAIQPAEASDFQGAYNWTPPAQANAYNLGPDPPSTVAENTDFSGSEMFEVAGSYGEFEVGDLMMPAWMASQSSARGPQR